MSEGDPDESEIMKDFDKKKYVERYCQIKCGSECCEPCHGLEKRQNTMYQSILKRRLKKIREGEGVEMSEICKACIESGVSKICGTSGGYVCEHYPERKRMSEISSIEKAIQVIKDLNFRLAKDGVTKQANDLAIQALEKQIPKAIAHEATVFDDGTCPNCKNVVKEHNQDFNYEYCHFCGQRLEVRDD